MKLRRFNWLNDRFIVVGQKLAEQFLVIQQPSFAEFFWRNIWNRRIEKKKFEVLLMVTRCFILPSSTALILRSDFLIA